MSGSLTIRHLRLTVVTPSDHPDPEMFRGKIEDEVRRSLPERLVESLGDLTQDGVLRIKRLELDLTFQDAASESRIAERLAEAIAEQVLKARESSDRIVSYRDRAHFLGAFLHELVLGRAWQRWWFRAFESLRVLPLSVAIRTAITADIAQGLAALLGMPREEAARVTAVMTRGDAGTLLRAFGESETSPPDHARIVAALIAAQEEAPLPPAPHDEAAALMLFADAVRVEKSAASPVLAELALSLAALGRVLPAMSAIQLKATLDSLRRGEMHAHTLHNGDDMVRLMPLIALPDDARRALIQAISRKHAADVTPSAPLARTFRTPFGGLFLLLPSLDVNGIAEATRQFETGEEMPRLVALFVLAACAGRRNFAAILSDPLWRDVFGVPGAGGVFDFVQRIRKLPPASWAALAAQGTPLTAVHDARFLLPPRKLAGSRNAARAIATLARGVYARFARRLPGFSTSSAPFLFNNVLAAPAHIEIAAGDWTLTLSRPPLDVLLSITGIANATIDAPGGMRVRVKRESL